MAQTLEITTPAHKLGNITRKACVLVSRFQCNLFLCYGSHVLDLVSVDTASHVEQVRIPATPFTRWTSVFLPVKWICEWYSLQRAVVNLQ